MASAPTVEAKISCTIYISSLVALFTASTIYHRYAYVMQPLLTFDACICDEIAFNHDDAYPRQGHSDRRAMVSCFDSFRRLFRPCRPIWRPETRSLLKRVDHAAIFVLIAGKWVQLFHHCTAMLCTVLLILKQHITADGTSVRYLNDVTGTYTPIAYVGLGGALGNRLLVMVWTGAAAGILQNFMWPRAPKTIKTGIYIALGWIIIPHAAEVIKTAGCVAVPQLRCWRLQSADIIPVKMFMSGHVIPWSAFKPMGVINKITNPLDCILTLPSGSGMQRNIDKSAAAACHSFDVYGTCAGRRCFGACECHSDRPGRHNIQHRWHYVCCKLA